MLSSTHPQLASEWSPENSKTVDQVTYGSHFKAVWICTLGHTYIAAVFNRVAGKACPYCAGRKVLPGFNDLATTHPEIAAQWSPENTELATATSAGSHLRVQWVCAEGHVSAVAVYVRVISECGECAVENRRVSPEHTKVRLHKYYRDNSGTILANRAKRWERDPTLRKANLQAQKRYRGAQTTEQKKARAEYNRQWAEVNKEHRKLYTSEYRQKNPEVGRKADRTRKALKLQTETEPYSETKILSLYGTDCHLCHESIDLEASRRVGVGEWQRGLHLDHVMPLSRGGADLIANIRPAHALCNIRKWATLMHEDEID